MDSRWHTFPEDCPNCGSSAEIFNAEEEDGYCYDGDSLRCPECKGKGWMVVDAEDTCYGEWNEDSFPLLDDEGKKLEMSTLDEKIDDFKRDLDTMCTQIHAVYALGKGPIEQAKKIPLAQWVKTRFVHVEDHNEAMTKVVRENERMRNALEYLDGKILCADFRSAVDEGLGRK